MPRVPSYDNFQSTPSAQPAVRFSPSQAPDAGDVNARQTQQMGQALQQSGGTVARLAADAVKDANETRAIDAVNKAKERMFDLQYGKETGYLNLKGDSALRRPNNQNLADEYVAKFKEQLAPIEQELGNLVPFEQPFATILTMVEVDPEDPAFQNPSKPIVPGYSEEEARRLAAEKGSLRSCISAEDAARDTWAFTSGLLHLRLGCQRDSGLEEQIPGMIRRHMALRRA